MKLFGLFFLLWCLPLHLPAQYETILNNPDVIWAAELDLEFWLEPEFTAPDSIYAGSCSSTMLKMINNAQVPDDESALLMANHLLSLLFEEDKPVYSQPESLHPLSWEQRMERVNFKDTVTIIDPETFMERNTLVVNCWSPESIQKMRVRQLLYYNNKTDEFKVYTLAFAPLMMRGYGALELENYYWYLPFWFKMPPPNPKKQRQELLRNKHITWARRMRTGTNMPPLDSLRPFKDFKPPVMQQYLNRVVQDPTYQVKGPGDWKDLPLAARIDEMIRVDTVFTFDPETYEETIIAVNDTLLGKEVMDLRLVQDWFWDEQRQFPGFQLYAFAPLIKSLDNDGNFRFKRPIFWRKLDD